MFAPWLSLPCLCADVFHMPSGQTSLAFVTVGDPGNRGSGDGTGPGAVSYSYKIGGYDVTLSQYCQFLNAVASSSDPYGVYHPQMATDFSTFGIARLGSAGSYTYTVTGAAADRNNMPIFDVSLGRCRAILQLAGERAAERDGNRGRERHDGDRLIHP